MHTKLVFYLYFKIKLHTNYTLSRLIRFILVCELVMRITSKKHLLTFESRKIRSFYAVRFLTFLDKTINC